MKKALLHQMFCLIGEPGSLSGNTGGSLPRKAEETMPADENFCH